MTHLFHIQPSLESGPTFTLSAKRKSSLDVPEIVPPTLRLHSSSLLAQSADGSFCLSPPLLQPSRVGCLHLPANCHPPTQQAWWLQPRLICVLLLPRQSRQSAPLNTPRFPWRAHSRCSATWQVPTAPSMRVSGWRMERRSQKHAPKIKTQSTGVCVPVHVCGIFYFYFVGSSEECCTLLFEMFVFDKLYFIVVWLHATVMLLQMLCGMKCNDII